MTEATLRKVTIAKQRFELRRDRIERAMRRVLPEPIASHYVTIGHRRYPPKQVIGLLTGLDRADFTSHQARRVLAGLGFPVGRLPRQDQFDESASNKSSSQIDGRAAHPDPRGSTGPMRPSAETLESFVGQWVATKGADVLVAADDPHAVVSWLAEHRKQADSMFRIPNEEFQADGLAPL